MFGSKPASALDAAQFRQLLEEQIDYVHHSLRRLGVNSPELEDLTQDVLLVVLRRWSDFDPARPLRPWLFGIAYRVALTRRRKTRVELPAGTLEDQLHPQVDVDAQHESRALVLAALKRIPLPRRAIFALHAIDGVDVKDAARELGIPLFTAYTRLKRARGEFETAIREILGQRQFSSLVRAGSDK